ncbi:MAG: hypothetical protein DI597_13150 [Pseudoxanthomonas spadix]|nr:MAG: hypothetical protein DI597_13150 [Pseudoxanthomonas spadix]
MRARFDSGRQGPGKRATGMARGGECAREGGPSRSAAPAGARLVGEVALAVTATFARSGVRHQKKPRQKRGFSIIEALTSIRR